MRKIQVKFQLAGLFRAFEFSRKELLATIVLFSILIIGIWAKYTIDQHWWLPKTQAVDFGLESIKLKIDLNKAEWFELMILPAIGEKKAKSIVEYRKAKGKFKTIEQLTGVNDIGIKTIKRIKDMVFISE